MGYGTRTRKGTRDDIYLDDEDTPRNLWSDNDYSCL